MPRFPGSARAYGVLVLVVGLATAAAQPPLADVDPCALLTDDEVSMHAGAVSATGTEDDLPTDALRQCTWFTDTPGALVSGVVVQVQRTRLTDAEALVASMEADAWFDLAAAPLDLAPYVAAVSVFADSAPQHVAMIAVLAGGLRLDLIPVDDVPTDGPAFAAYLALARLAAERLPRRRARKPARPSRTGAWPKRLYTASCCAPSAGSRSSLAASGG